LNQLHLERHRLCRKLLAIMPDSDSSSPSESEAEVIPDSDAGIETGLGSADNGNSDGDSSLDRARHTLRAELAKGMSMSKAIAFALDELIRIPGTKFRIGLDPILGLIPYGGEAVSSLIGCFLLADAGKKGIPFRTLLKMSGNVIINATVSTFPVLGDIFSAWFKSNSRNYQMLQHWMNSEEGQQAKGGWGPLLLVCAVGLTVAAITIGMWILVITLLSTIVYKIGGVFS
jgi:hypothetical protein